MTTISSPPDGGWGWVIVAAAFFCHILGGAVFGALGVLYIGWLDEFDLGKSQTSWIISLAFGVLFCIGPVASTLTNRYSCKMVAVTGSIMASVGYVLSYWAPSVPFLIVSIGIVAVASYEYVEAPTNFVLVSTPNYHSALPKGTGSGFTYVACVVVVTTYFRKNLSVATGIYASGAGLGNFIMAPLMNYLDDAYGWRGALLITGAIVFHTCAASLFFTPFTATLHHDKTETKSSLEQDFEIDIKEISYPGTEDIVGECVQEMTAENPKVTLRSCENGQIMQLHTTVLHSSKTNMNCIGPEYSVNNPIKATGKENVPLQNCIKLDVYKNNSKNKEQKSHLVNNFTPSSIPNDIHNRENESSPFIGGTKLCPPLPPMPLSIQHLKASGVHARASNSLGDLSEKKNQKIFLSQSLHNSVQVQSQSHQSLCKSLRNLELPALGSLKSLYTTETIKSYHDDDVEDTCSDACTSTVSTLMETGDKRNNETTCCSDIQLFQSFLVNVEILRDKTFLVLFVSSFFTCMSYATPLVFMVDRAVDSNIEKTLAAGLISLNGAGNIFGRLLFGFVADRVFSNHLMTYIGVILLSGVSTVLSPLCGDYLVLHGIYAIIFGLTTGAIAVLGVVVTVDLMGQARMASAFGMYLLSAGMGSVLGPPLGGWLFDWTQTYTLTYIVTGFFTVISAAILIPLEVFRRRGCIAPRYDQGHK